MSLLNRFEFSKEFTAGTLLGWGWAIFIFGIIFSIPLMVAASVPLLSIGFYLWATVTKPL
jgi:hypothetical protein